MRKFLGGILQRRNEGTTTAAQSPYKTEQGYSDSLAPINADQVSLANQPCTETDDKRHSVSRGPSENVDPSSQTSIEETTKTTPLAQEIGQKLSYPLATGTEPDQNHSMNQAKKEGDNGFVPGKSGEVDPLPLTDTKKPNQIGKGLVQVDEIRLVAQEPLGVTNSLPMRRPELPNNKGHSTAIGQEHTFVSLNTDQDTATDPGHRMPMETPKTVKIDDLETDDIVIAIMGPTGAGKSTFIRSASGYDTQGIGHSLKSFTSQVHTIRFWDQESRRHVVLVDTPGFDDTYKSDYDILNMISEWLNKSYSRKKLLSAILYFHRITDNRMAGTPLKNLRLFRKLCGRDALETVYLTTTMWDEVDEEVGKRRLNELGQDYWKEMIDRGAHVVRCRSDDDSPKKLLREILDQENVHKALLLQEEMGKMKKELKETSAGQQLFSHLETLVAKQTELLRRIQRERRAASDTNMLNDLQKEYDELRVQIDEKSRQMQELKLPWFTKNFRRFVSRKRD